MPRRAPRVVEITRGSVGANQRIKTAVWEEIPWKYTDEREGTAHKKTAGGKSKKHLVKKRNGKVSLKSRVKQGKKHRKNLGPQFKRSKRKKNSKK